MRLAGRFQSFRFFDDQLRIQRVEHLDQGGCRFGLMLANHIRQHQGECGDCLLDAGNRFEAVGVCGVIAAQQRQFECMRQDLDRCYADGSGDAGKGMRSPVHFVRCRGGQVCFQERELALQSSQVSTGFFVKDLGQCRSDRKLCAGFLYSEVDRCRCRLAGFLWKSGWRSLRKAFARRCCSGLAGQRQQDAGFAAVAKGIGQSDHARYIRCVAAPGLEMLDPREKDAVGLFKQVQEDWRDFLFLS
ncbi:MAG: hypothetical protein AW09_003851 [Candidatus Accumulibacter phosphatis]|uniref:Uncharacterized protein n=1 Tax=Candidatus Accumulibacter phosphatis TaxID=327160 RepID=A0A080LTV7_9PROT|nr:MAG: hypothetical protein AW09_003851 [Candidatus Accumulibacter phosphatis]